MCQSQRPTKYPRIRATKMSMMATILSGEEVGMAEAPTDGFRGPVAAVGWEVILCLSLLLSLCVCVCVCVRVCACFKNTL